MSFARCSRESTLGSYNFPFYGLESRGPESRHASSPSHTLCSVRGQAGDRKDAPIQFREGGTLRTGQCASVCRRQCLPLSLSPALPGPQGKT